MFGFITKNFFNSFNDFIKFSNYNYSRLYFNNYCVFFRYFFTISIGVYFVYYKCINCSKENISKYDYIYQSKNY